MINIIIILMLLRNEFAARVSKKNGVKAMQEAWLKLLDQISGSGAGTIG